ncbi:MAG: hypothetical protein ACYTDY_04440 [Planctomycetota bacterium]|jgi:hypothetical protein
MWNEERFRGAFARAALSFVVLVFCLLGPDVEVPEAYAEVPAGNPTFSNPLTINNPFFPVVPGTVKVYSGREDGDKATVVETHLTETRDFEWNGQTVPCRIVQELKFESGALRERESSFYAQADNGAVYFFGETEEIEDDDDEEEEEDEPGGWIVGQRLASDPADVVTGAEPTIIMPAVPDRGDVWNPENIPPHFLEVLQVVRVNERVKTPAGRYLGCARLRESVPSERGSELLWFAPGVGMVKVRGRGTRLRLQASILEPKEEQ